MTPPSKLSLAVLRCLPADGSAISHQELRARLAQDVWASRNQHRLGRLDSTLACMSRDGQLRVSDEDVVMIVRPGGQLQEAIADGFTQAAKSAGFMGQPRTFGSAEGALTPLTREQAHRIAEADFDRR